MNLQNSTTKAPDEVSAQQMLHQIKNAAYTLAGTKEEGHEVPLEMEVTSLETIASLADRVEDAMPSDAPEITTQIKDMARTMAAAAKAGMILPSSNYHVLEDLAAHGQDLLG